MVIFKRSDLKKIPELLPSIEFRDYDSIGFNASIKSKSGKRTEVLRFDYPFASEAIAGYINEDPLQCLTAD